MKKVLSILIASALAAAPLTMSVSADEAKSSCGIKNAIDKVITAYTYAQGGENTGNGSGCNVSEIIKKVSELRKIIGDAANSGNCPDGSCENENTDECPGNSCPGENENTCPGNSCENENNCPDGSCGNTEIIIPGTDDNNNVPSDTPEEIPDWLQNIINGGWNSGNNNQPENPDEDKTEDNNTDIQVPDDSMTSQVIELVNNYRAQYGLSPVSYDAKVSQAAAIRAKEQETVFSHTRPNGTRCFTALDECGVSYRGAGENIAMGQNSASEVMNDWMNSEGHRANILNESFTKIGVGLYTDSNGRCYWAQMFIY